MKRILLCDNFKLKKYYIKLILDVWNLFHISLIIFSKCFEIYSSMRHKVSTVVEHIPQQQFVGFELLLKSSEKYLLSEFLQ